MDEITQPQQSHLFTVRIWPEVIEPASGIWRGKVQHVPSGAWRSFQDWGTLVAFLQTQMQEFVAETQQPQS